MMVAMVQNGRARVEMDAAVGEADTKIIGMSIGEVAMIGIVSGIITTHVIIVTMAIERAVVGLVAIVTGVGIGGTMVLRDVEDVIKTKIEDEGMIEVHDTTIEEDGMMTRVVMKIGADMSREIGVKRTEKEIEIGIVKTEATGIVKKEIQEGGVVAVPEDQEISRDETKMMTTKSTNGVDERMRLASKKKMTKVP